MGLPLPNTVLVVVILALAWVAIVFTWRYHRQAFTSYGRNLSARVRAYRHFLTEVHRDQLDFGAQQGVHHLHPAIALLPYAIVLGLGDSWYERFGPLMAELSARGPGDASASTGAGVPWWGYAGGYSAFQSTRSASVTDPSAASSGGGGGGAGSGGGGGGGGSW